MLWVCDIVGELDGQISSVYLMRRNTLTGVRMIQSEFRPTQIKFHSPVEYNLPEIYCTANTAQFLFTQMRTYATVENAPFLYSRVKFPKSRDFSARILVNFMPLHWQDFCVGEIKMVAVVNIAGGAQYNQFYTRSHFCKIFHVRICRVNRGTAVL